jgi:hypothetical protein
MSAQIELAFPENSGILTTNLGKTATFDKVAGRERRVHHSKSLPLLLTGERFFFVLSKSDDWMQVFSSNY